jgi:hypothetical protein
MLHLRLVSCMSMFDGKWSGRALPKRITAGIWNRWRVRAFRALATESMSPPRQNFNARVQAVLLLAATVPATPSAARRAHLVSCMR